MEIYSWHEKSKQSLPSQSIMGACLFCPCLRRCPSLHSVFFRRSPSICLRGLLAFSWIPLGVREWVYSVVKSGGSVQCWLPSVPWAETVSFAPPSPKTLGWNTRDREWMNMNDYWAQEMLGAHTYQYVSKNMHRNLTLVHLICLRWCCFGNDYLLFPLKFISKSLSFSEDQLHEEDAKYSWEVK